MSAYEDIYHVTRQIPRGKVATYRQIAYLCGRERQARLVGYALHRVDLKNDDIPWQRVVNARGEISYSSLRRGSDYSEGAGSRKPPSFKRGIQATRGDDRPLYVLI
jgi:methylated-DNA-protein-cysteine methyltransferase related protein